MEIDFLTPSRFRILKEIANSPNSVSNIARKIKLSIPYVLNQVTLLEAKGFIKKEKENNSKNPGKPKKIFSISNPEIHLTLIHEGFSKQISIENPKENFIKYLQIITFINPKLHCEFSKYYWNQINEFNQISALGILESKENVIELLAITSQENLEKLRKTIANQKISLRKDKTVTIVCWVHTFEEIQKGQEEKDFYYENLIKNVKPIIDLKKQFNNLKGVSEK